MRCWHDNPLSRFQLKGLAQSCCEVTAEFSTFTEAAEFYGMVNAAIPRAEPDHGPAAARDEPPVRRLALAIMDYCASEHPQDWSASHIGSLVGDFLAARSLEQTREPINPALMDLCDRLKKAEAGLRGNLPARDLSQRRLDVADGG